MKMVTEQRQINSIEIKVLIHATEDIKKVERAVRNILPPDFPIIFEEQKLSGHYGDPITILSLNLKRRKPSTEAFEHIFRRLPTLSKEEVLTDLEKRIDKSGNFYLRLDKQKAYQSKVVPSNIDPIRIKFRFYVPHRSDPKVIITSYLENLTLLDQQEK